MKLEIKEPCGEDWNKMKNDDHLIDRYQIGLNSRHCEVCVKSVVDFTEMNRGEIIAYLLSNKGDQVCGRLRRDQFDFKHEDIPILISTLRNKPFTNAFMILALVSISLSASAQEQNTGTINTPPAVHQEKTRGMVQVAKPGTIEPLDTLKCVEVPLKPEPLIEVLGGAPVLVIEPDMIEGGITHMADSRIKVYESGILPYADKMPEYCGGIDALYEFIEENINYPKWELKKSIHGNVYVRFIVNADGTLRDAQILNSIPNSKNIDAEVLRLISIMPDWEAGENQGAKTPVYMTIPITFHLK